MAVTRAPPCRYSRPLDSFQSVTRVLLLLASTHTSSPLLASTRFSSVTRVLLLLASTRTSSPLLASTRFSPVCYSRLLAYSRLASTRILPSTGTGWGRKLPYMCFSVSRVYSQVFPSTSYYSPLLAYLRLLALLRMRAAAYVFFLVTPCYSHTLACLRRY